MGPISRRVAFAAAILICSVPALAQDKAPQPIPRFEDEVVPHIPPEVTYTDGSLRIVARQARLAEVLDAIRAETGAVVSVNPEIAEQPVSIKLGPATLLSVINDLLQATDCNYVVMGSPDRPSGIRVAVLPRPHEAEPVAHEAETAALDVTAQANLKTPGNIPDEWIVTFTKPAVKAESTSSTKEPVVAAAEAANETQQKTAPK
jgi:hypothetical protein